MDGGVDRLSGQPGPIRPTRSARLDPPGSINPGLVFYGTRGRGFIAEVGRAANPQDAPGDPGMTPDHGEIRGLTGRSHGARSLQLATKTARRHRKGSRTGAGCAPHHANRPALAGSPSSARGGDRRWRPGARRCPWKARRLPAQAQAAFASLRRLRRSRVSSAGFAIHSPTLSRSIFRLTGFAR